MIEITAEPLDVQKVLKSVYAEDCGAVSLFIGTVRKHSRGKEVTHLEYDVYPEMAIKMIQRIIDEARVKWDVRKISVSHRTGNLAIGDLAVIIAVATPHRQEAFKVCQFAIDRLKEVVPIWKKEVAVDGETWIDSHA